MLLVFAVAMGTYSFTDPFINNGRWVLSDKFNFFVFLLDSVCVSCILHRDIYLRLGLMDRAGMLP